MFNIFKAFFEMYRLVKLANQFAEDGRIREGRSKKEYGFLFTNRSFLVPAIGMCINILVLFNLPMFAPVLELVGDVPAEHLATFIIGSVTAVSGVWAVMERSATTAKIVFTPSQAKNALYAATEDSTLANTLIGFVKGKIKR